MCPTCRLGQATVGDLTSTLGAAANASVPALPAPPRPAFALSGSCSTLSQDKESGGAAITTKSAYNRLAYTRRAHTRLAHTHPE